MKKTDSNAKLHSKKNRILWSVAGLLIFALLFARAIYPELLALTVVLGVLLLGIFGALIAENQKALKTRSAAYGLNSFITTVLFLGILGVLSFLSSRYSHKWDLTRNKIHTLSDHTSKVVKSLKQEVKVTFFSKLQQKEQFRPLLENYHALNPQFEISYLDPDREPVRAKQMGVKKYGTLHLSVGSRENRIEDITEEKITNALIKLLKEKSPTLCVTTGHGEKLFASQDAEGYASVRKNLMDQSYEVKELALLQETKIPETCDALAILGPTKAFFHSEVKAIAQYLAEGGRGIIALDVNLKGGEYAPEMVSMLSSWYIRPLQAMIVDPLSRMLGVDASVAVLANFSRTNPITRDFQSNCAFPLTRPLEILPRSPLDLKIEWLAQTTPKSWSVTDLASLEKGEVQFKEGRDRMGPLNAAVTVEGKLEKSSPKKTRMVVFGTSYFATNHFSRYAGNLDFFLNAVSWVMEDESLISIRSQEEEAGKVELSQKAGNLIFLLTVIVLPILIAIGGLGIWIARKKL
jgi:ABC-type uncharacterized transport system involved in gliding motility auxiliary subunit